ncbi:hypothetical protein GFGA_1d1501 [Gluconobacter frateurii NBRC 103465]|nr:hypothetical protein GFGA_1d1501 [Gluconobacter frateurii NBRC 103465]
MLSSYATSHQSGQGLQGFAAGHPKQPVRPSGETGHRPNSISRSAHVCPAKGSSTQDVQHTIEKMAVISGRARPTSTLRRQKRTNSCLFSLLLTLQAGSESDIRLIV